MASTDTEIPVDAPEIPGARQSGEIATEPTPESAQAIVAGDPRLADITETVEPHGEHFLLVHSRGDHTRTVEFEAEPTDAMRAEQRRLADELFDLADARFTTELQDRRRPK